MSNCLPCSINPCDPVIVPTCDTQVGYCCEDSYPSRCVFITEKLICTNGRFYIASDSNLNDALRSILCKIDELETKILHIQQTCCNEILTCDFPQIISIK